MSSVARRVSDLVDDAAPVPADLLALARKRFIRGERMDIAGLANELGVSRATAYRWAGGNVDQLTAMVIGALAAETGRRAIREVRGLQGWDRILAVQELSLRYMSSFAPYRAFLQREREGALRIVATKAGSAQQAMIEQNQELLEEEARLGNLRLPVDAHTLAYAAVRICESFLYADLIAGEDPDIDKAVQVLRLLSR